MEKKQWIIKIKGTETFVVYSFLIRFKDKRQPICGAVEFSSKGYNVPQMFDSQDVASEVLFAIKNKVPVELQVVEADIEDYRKELYNV